MAERLDFYTHTGSMCYIPAHAVTCSDTHVPNSHTHTRSELTTHNNTYINTYSNMQWHTHTHSQYVQSPYIKMFIIYFSMQWFLYTNMLIHTFSETCTHLLTFIHTPSHVYTLRHIYTHSSTCIHTQSHVYTLRHSHVYTLSHIYIHSHL
jgi:hypothetical protein